LAELNRQGHADGAAADDGNVIAVHGSTA
jgi:hypothetical protein